MGVRDHLRMRRRGRDGGAPRSRLRPSTVVLLSVSGTFLLALAAAAAAAQTTPAPVGLASASSSQVSDVDVAFARQCAGCHGPEGEGALGPDLRTWTGTIEDTTTLLSQGAGGMPAFSPTLTPEQIGGLAEALDALVGVTAYESNCSACHGTWGEGGIGPSLKTSVGLDDDARRAVIVEGIGSMRGFGDTLTDAEVDALVRRLDGYAEVGPSIFAHQCAACHGDQGQGLTGPALAGSTIALEEAEAIVTSGFGGMPAFGPTLEDGDVAAVVAFVFTLEAAPADTTTTTSAPTTTTSTTTSTTTTIPATTTTEAAPAASGTDVYAAHCAVCHGGDAEGGAGPPLVGIDVSAEEVAAAIIGGQGSMPGFSGVLDEAEIDAVVAYLEGLAQPVTPEPDETGAEVYAQHCTACHGEDARGGVGPSLRTTQLTGDALRDAIAQGNATMPAFSRTLDAADFEAVVRYVEGLRGVDDGGGPALQGGPEIYNQDCSACHGARGEGGIGPRLQGTELTVNEIIARVYGGHTSGMPAFEGALDGRQVRDVAHYIQTFEATDEGQEGLGIGAVLGIAAGGVLLLAAIALGVVRWRRRRA